MKKNIIVSTLLMGAMSINVYAGGDIGELPLVDMDARLNVIAEPVKKVVKQTVKKAPEKKVEKKVAPIVVPDSGKGYYTVVKALYLGGTTVGHETSKVGAGIGADVGYRFGNGIEAELGVSYSGNKLDTAEQESINYKAIGLGIVYAQPFNKKFGGFVKTGVLYEVEKIAGHTSTSEKGIAYGGGLEYVISKKTAVVLEYEGSTISNSLAGEVVSLGFMYSF